MTTRTWVTFLIRRALGLILVILALATATFLMVRLIPGDPAVIVAGEEGTTRHIEQIRAALGLDQPIGTQFVRYMTGLAHGDLGNSFRTRVPVSAIIASNIGHSIQLAVLAILLVVPTSISLGIIAAAHTQGGSRRRGELAFTASTSIVGSLPEFLMATFLAFVFAVWLRLLPVGGADTWQALVLPVISIALRPIATLARIVRVETLAVLAQDYVRTARSKRLPPRLVYVRHCLPNIVTAALTIGGLLFANLIGGAVLVENVFARPGLGTQLVTAVINRDYPVIQGCIFVLGIAVVVVNAFVDILVGIADPRSLNRQG